MPVRTLTTASFAPADALTSRAMLTATRRASSLAALRLPRFVLVLAAVDEAQMTWRETMIVAAISVLLSAAITLAIRIVMENAGI